MVNKLYVTILAGGMGKRMNSDVPKVLHKIKGESMIIKLLKQVHKLNPDRIIIVVGKSHEMIQKEIDANVSDTSKILYAKQQMPLGTGDAVKSTLYLFDGGEEITNLILNGDVPLIRSDTLKSLLKGFDMTGSKFMITSINLQNPTGNGRIIIDSEGGFQEIIEEKDCTPEQKLLTLVNCGIYICDSRILSQLIPKIKCNNSQGEYYLTDLVKIYRDETDELIHLHVLDQNKEIEIYNVNTLQQLQYIEKT